MILYSKSGDFLGIGKDELSFLGYEDLDEFRSFHSDVADLFINKPGYIFKFKNFSWIDYALHSGAPKKSVIIRLKSGNEVEIALKIKELFLYKEKDDIYYSVEFINNSLQSNTTSINDINIQSTPSSVATTTNEITIDEPSDIKVEKVIEEISIAEDFIDNDISDDYKTEVDDTPKIQLKSDYKLLNEESDFKIKQEEPNIKEAPKDSIEIDEDYKPIGIKLDLDNDKVTKEESDDFDFDLVQCVDDLGLDISLVCELLSDYLEKIDTSLPIIKSSIESEDKETLKNNIYELKGISDNLKILKLSSILESILEATNIDDKLQKLERFERIVVKFREELA